MPVELVIDIENKENYNSLLKEKVTIQDATKVSFICKECNKKTVVKSFYNWRKRSSVFIEIKGTHLLGKNPFNLKDSRSVAKYQCMIDNDVEILSGEFFAPLLKKYPKRFFKKFREN